MNIRDGRDHGVLSAHGAATLAADSRAFAPQANRLFTQPIPAALSSATGKRGT